MIELRNVGKIYKSRKSVNTVALQDVSLKFENSGMVFIVGKSGSGKSTLLNILGGLDSVSSGEIFVENKNLISLSNKELDSYRNSYVGFIFQEFNILEQYNVYENIELSLRLQREEFNKDKVLQILDWLDLNGLEYRKINELSGGQKQRVAIGRAIIKNPKLILADEPTGNLDFNSGNQVFDILKNISKEHLVIVVSHNMEAAKKYVDRIIEIQDGRVINDSNVCINSLGNDLTLKDSKLPFKYAFKMSLNSFKFKPLKFFMTVLLTALSLVFMGVGLTLQFFDKDSLIINTLKDNDVHFIDLSKMAYHEDDRVFLNFDQNDIDFVSSLMDDDINLVYDLFSDALFLNFEFDEQIDNSVNTFYGNDILNLKIVDVKDSRIIGNVIGKEIFNSDEVIIHKYLADCIIKYGVKGVNGVFKPNNYKELVESNSYIKLGYNNVKIVGIVDDDDSLYIKAKDNNFFDDDALYDYFIDNYVSKGSYVYTKGFVSNAVLVQDIEKAYFNSVYVFGYDMSFDNLRTTGDVIHIIEGGNGATRKLEDNEIFLSLNSFYDSAPFKDGLFEFLKDNDNMSFNEAKFMYSSKYFRESILNKRVIIQDKLSGDKQIFFVAGLIDSDYSYISDKVLKNFTPRQKEIKSVRVFIDDYNSLGKLFDVLKFCKEIDKYDTSPQYVFSVDHDTDIYKVIFVYREAKLFIICICLVFLIFAFMLFSNFLGVSITNSKKEIGTLRALGAGRNDVFRIFCFESLIIALMSSILGIIGWLIVCSVLNNTVFGKLYFQFEGFIIKPIVPFMLLIFMIFIALIITLGFINKISKIKPIDAILNK